MCSVLNLTDSATPLKKGKFLVLEGTDGSGKATQWKKLIKRLKKEGIPVAQVDFPQYGQPSAYFIEQYLNGRYGNWEKVGPYCASLFYALDRFEAKEKMEKALQSGKLLVANRYLPSNMSYQGAKIVGRTERQKFFRWLIELEYGILGLPRPTKTLILYVPTEVAQTLIDKKGKRRYLGKKKRDIHEVDVAYLKRVETIYLQLAKTFPEDFVVLECVQGGKLLSKEEIHEKIWQLVKEILNQN